MIRLSPNPRRWTAFVCLCLACLLITAVTTLGAENSSEARIVFVRLHMTDGAISLVGTTTVPGTLKEPRDGRAAGGMQYEATSKDGSVVSSGSIPNPLVRRFEYEDPENKGELKMKVVRLTEADFVIRLRYDATIDRIYFYKTDESSESPAKAVARRLLGTVPLNLSEGGKQ